MSIIKSLVLTILVLLTIVACDPPNNKNTNQLFNTKNKQLVIPDMMVKDLDGNSINFLSKITENGRQGKITLVSFWATWCAPCSLEFNELKPNYKSWVKKYNFEIIAISIDEKKIYPNLSAYANRKDWPFTFYYDEGKALSQKLKVDNIPKSYLIDKTGKIVNISSYYYEGIGDEIEAMLKQM